MSTAELNHIIETNLDRSQAIHTTGIPENVVNSLLGKGIRTVGALADTDAFRTIASGRYDINQVCEVNGIPIAALRWLLDALPIEGDALCAV